MLQSVAALHAVYGENGEKGGNLDVEETIDAEVRQTSENWDEIRYRAACSIQEHAIKMTEACFRADQLDPDPIYRIAAADAALRLDGTRMTVGC